MSNGSSVSAAEHVLPRWRRTFTHEEVAVMKQQLITLHTTHRSIKSLRETHQSNRSTNHSLNLQENHWLRILTQSARQDAVNNSFLTNLRDNAFLLKAHDICCFVSKIMFSYRWSITKTSDPDILWSWSWPFGVTWHSSCYGSFLWIVNINHASILHGY